MPVKKPSRGYLTTVFGCRCPRCREGKLFQFPTSINFKLNMAMHKNCLVCGQPTEIEVGFYYGTAFVSYGLTVALSVVSFVAWVLTIGISVDDNRLFWWLGFNAVLLIVMQPWLMRLSRSLWISWFVRYDPDWKQHKLDDFERIVPEQMNNW